MGISEKDCKRITNDKLICQYVDEIDLATLIFNKIIDCIDIHFGIRQGQISDAFIKKAVTKIATEFPKLSVQDIEYSFDRYNVPKKDNWKNITIEELIAPIKHYYNIKNRVINERIKLEREISESNERKRLSDVFYQGALKKYSESLKIDSWIGDMYEAKVLLNKFTRYFNEEERIEFKRQAKYQFNQIQEKNDFNSIIYTEERLLAQLVVSEAINRKIKL